MILDRRGGWDRNGFGTVGDARAKLQNVERYDPLDLGQRSLATGSRGGIKNRR